MTQELPLLAAVLLSLLSSLATAQSDCYRMRLSGQKSIGLK